jgi:multidrug efflux pump subunit AcrA (membrane-fusion protein)
LVLVIVALLAAVSYFVFIKKSKASAAKSDDTEWLTVKRENFEIKSSDEGDLRPVKVTALSFLRSGKVSWLIAEGTPVKKGDKLVSLETKDLEEAISNLQRDLDTAEKTLAQNEQNRDIELKRLENDLLSERERLAVAQLRENEMLCHPTALEKEDTENKLAGARARMESATTDLETYQSLLKEGFGKQGDVDARKLTLDKANVEMRRATMKAAQTFGGALPYDREKERLNREQAETGLKLKEIEVAESTANLHNKVRQAQRDLETSKHKLARQQDQFDKSTLLAPHDGIVVYRPNWNGKKIEVNERVNPWGCPIELPSYEKMKVRTKVPESFVRKLQARSQGENGVGAHPGSKARVTVKTQPDITYDAEVIWIDGWARDKNSKLPEADMKVQGLSGVRVFDLEVEILKSDPQRLREGFRATVEFPFETIPNAISVPENAIIMQDVLEDGKAQPAAHVRVNHNNEPQLRRVKLGAECQGRVVVTSGLEEGDQVLVRREKPVAQAEAAAPEKGSGGKKAIPNAPPGTGGSGAGAPTTPGQGPGGMRPSGGGGRRRGG